MQIQEVFLNHDTSSASADALTIRQSASGAQIQAPEWRAGHTSQPAAYVARAPAGAMTIKARISGGLPGVTAEVRAVDAGLRILEPVGWWRWWRLLVVPVLILLRPVWRLFYGGSVLGEVAPKTIVLNAAGNSGATVFVLKNHRLASSGVGIRTVRWRWQVRQGWTWTGPKWVDIGTTEHRIYLVLDTPQGPWVQTSGSSQLPWVSALEKACVWAAGATTKDQAAKKITEAVNLRPTQSYTPMTIFGFASYGLSSYLNALDGGLPFALNCTDCANAATTLSNLLGCDLWEGRFFNMVTRKFLTLNGDPTHDSDWVSWSWGYHEICWLGSIGPSQKVYDACLQLDMDNDDSDTVHVPLHPVKMPFDVGSPDDYHTRLIASGSGNLENIPRRRALI